VIPALTNWTSAVREILKGVIFVAALLGTPVFAAAQDAAEPAKGSKNEAETRRLRRPEAPLPLVIPQQFAPPQEAYASFPDATGAAVPKGPAEPSACQLRLAKIAVFEPLPTLVGPGECGAMDAVQLNSVVLPDQTKVALVPPAALRCTMAEQVAFWVREDVAPAVQRLGSALRSIDDYDSYECRGRNRVRGATLSEHGRANAIDIRGFKLADGKTIELTDVKVAKDWRDDLRASACARFSTVLGPGSDGNHEEHIHLDLAERRGGYKMCEWEVREPLAEAKQAEPPPGQTVAKIEDPPLPRPRPVANADELPRSFSKKLR